MLNVEDLLRPSSQVATKEACAKLAESAKEHRLTRRFTSLHCELFPRGAAEVLHPYLTRLEEFQHSYGPVAVRNLQNPDLKSLVKAYGDSLRIIRIAPSPEYTFSAVSPKLQGCGYRALTKYCNSLIELGIPVGYDVKKQLLPRLHVSHLIRVTLYDVPKSLTAKELRAFVKRCPKLEVLELHGEKMARFRRGKLSAEGLKRADKKVLFWEAKEAEPLTNDTGKARANRKSVLVAVLPARA